MYILQEEWIPIISGIKQNKTRYNIRLCTKEDFNNTYERNYL